MKKSNLIVFFVVGTSFIIGTSFLLRLEPVKKYLREHDSNYQREISCFTIMPYKCGHIDGTNNEILWQIRRLQITKEEARDLILEAKRENGDTLRVLESKDALTPDEKILKPLKEMVVGYHERVLRIIEETSFYWASEMDYERDRRCFIEVPGECGPGYNATDGEISFEVYWLGPGKSETQELVLKAQGDERMKMEKLMSKESLNKAEEQDLEESRKLQSYYARILRVMDQME